MLSKILDISPRVQWEGNYGYCGETSFQCAGLYYGQWASQYHIRALASSNTDQSQSSSQLLLGVNDAFAASQLGLQCSTWNGSGSKKFLAWVKYHVLAGHPVAIGVYINNSVMPGGGDAEYDHIVLAIGIESNHALTDSSYYDDDVIVFSDHGLYGPPTPFIFKYQFGQFQNTRSGADQPRSGVYSLADTAANYGIALTGRITPTLPVSIKASPNSETPAVMDGYNMQPRSTQMDFLISGSEMMLGHAYILKTGTTAWAVGTQTEPVTQSYYSNDVVAYTLEET